MSDFFNKGYNPNAQLVNLAGGGVGKAAAAVSKGLVGLGDIKQKSKDRKVKKARFDLEDKRYDNKVELEATRHKEKFDLEKMNKEDDAKARKANIAMTRKIHPIFSKDLNDDEVYEFGKTNNKLHNDKSDWKHFNSTTMENGHKVSYHTNGKLDENGNLMVKMTDHGKAKSAKVNNKNDKTFQIKNEDGTTTTWESYQKDGKRYKRKVKEYTPPVKDTGDTELPAFDSKPKQLVEIDTRKKRIAKQRAKSKAAYKQDKEEKKNPTTWTQRIYNSIYK